MMSQTLSVFDHFLSQLVSGGFYQVQVSEEKIFCPLTWSALQVFKWTYKEVRRNGNGL